MDGGEEAPLFAVTDGLLLSLHRKLRARRSNQVQTEKTQDDALNVCPLYFIHHDKHLSFSESGCPPCLTSFLLTLFSITIIGNNTAAYSISGIEIGYHADARMNRGTWPNEADKENCTTYSPPPTRKRQFLRHAARLVYFHRVVWRKKEHVVDEFWKAMDLNIIYVWDERVCMCNRVCGGSRSLANKYSM